MAVFPILFLLLTFYFYGKKNPAMVLFSITLILTDGFGLLSESDFVFQKTDFLLFPVVVISFLEYTKNRGFFDTKDDVIGKVIKINIVFLLLEFVRTVFGGIDGPVWAAKVVRVQGLFLLYFYVRSINPIIVKKYLRLVLVCSMAQGVLYYLQLIGLTGILATGYGAGSEGDNIRYGNYPLFTIFFTVYYIAAQNVGVGKRLFMLFFWGIMLLLSQNRGYILGVAASYGMVILLYRNFKSVTYLLGGVAVYLLLVVPAMERRTSAGDSGNTRGDVMLLMNSSVRDMAQFSSTQVGSVAFRFGMVAERWIYLRDNPQYIPFGVGCIHEQSPANRFMFSLGSKNEKYKYGRCMIESGDIAWCPQLLRYGLLGVFLCAMLFYVWIKFGIKKYKVLTIDYSKTGCLISVCSAITTLNAPLFDSALTLSLLCLYLGLTVSESRSNKLTTQCFRV